MRLRKQQVKVECTTGQIPFTLAKMEWIERTVHKVEHDEELGVLYGEVKHNHRTLCVTANIGEELDEIEQLAGEVFLWEM